MMSFAQIFILCVCLAVFMAVLLALFRRRNDIMRARCTFDMNDVKGFVHLYGLGSYQTLAVCELTGLKPGLHGLHVHHKADYTKGCASTCSHFNPNGSQHGGARGSRRHKGDFGNIKADEKGVSRTHVVADVGLTSILDRPMVIHEGEDDLGMGTGESLKTGNSGDRIACSTIQEISEIS